MYTVIDFFHDAQDGLHLYNKGDVYPREGIKSTKKRIDDLVKRGYISGQNESDQNEPAE